MASVVIPVVRLPPGGQWDQHMLDVLLAGRLYPHGIDFEVCEPWPEAPGVVLVAPGRYWYDRTGEIAEALHRYVWVLAIRTSDEEDLFNPATIRHVNVKWWVQSPRIDRDYGNARLFGTGFPPHFSALGGFLNRTVDVFVAAQETHARRVQCFEALKNTHRTQNVLATKGFTQGMKPAEYALSMCSARVAPAPSGPVTADTFRLFEALEAHAIPIADDYCPMAGRAGYWQRLFPDAPFPILTDYQDLPGYIDDALRDYPRSANRIAAWWIGHKRKLSRWLREDLRELGVDVR